MIVTPPSVPKGYEIRTVRNTTASAPEHTNLWFPSVTQTTLRQFASPIFPLKWEKPGEYRVTPVNERVLDKWTKASRAWWIDKPGYDSKFMDEMMRKYTVIVQPELDPRYKHRPTIFPRSFKYEIDCIEENRLKLLKLKTLKEEEDDRKKYPHIFVNRKDNSACIEYMTRFAKTEYPRWQEEPRVVNESTADECLRRLDMSRVGLPFKNEACHFYYEHYPPPDVKFRPEKFS